MGNRVARLAYTNEATAAAWAVVGKRGLTGVPATPEAEAQLFLDVSQELRRQALGMPPGLNRTSLAAAVREVGVEVWGRGGLLHAGTAAACAFAGMQPAACSGMADTLLRHQVTYSRPTPAPAPPHPSLPRR